MNRFLAVSNVKSLVRMMTCLVILSLLSSCSTLSEGTYGAKNNQVVRKNNSPISDEGESVTEAQRLKQLAVENAQLKSEHAKSQQQLADLAANKAAEAARKDVVFDVSANKVPASAFFTSLVQDTDLNMVIHPDVTGNITMRLKQVTLEEALEAVRDVYGIDYLVKSYGYQIVPRKLKSKLFRVNYLNINRAGESSMLVSSGQVSVAEGSDDSEREDDDSGDAGGGDELVQSSEIITRSRADFWNNLHSVVETIVGTTDGRKVMVDAESGIVVVKAYPSELKSVETFLDRAELSLKKQVIIEAKIMEVVLSEGYQSGIQWDTFGLGYNGDLTSTNNNVVMSLTPDTFTTLIDNTLEGFSTIGVNYQNFTAVINLLEAHGDVNVLSTPRISTVNNQKAVIKVGTDEYFVTDISNDTTSTSTSTSQSPELTLTPFFSGIALDVTPHIGENDEVVLHVHPTITEVLERVKNIGLGTQVLTLPLAFSTIRETDSVIRAKSGQVVVIGGLMQEKTTATSAGIPIVSNIPYLGHLFKQEKDLTVKTELVILLKPVVSSEGVWKDEESLIKQRFPQFYADDK